MLNISALIAGLVFGLGLVISGMANPAKVLGFLDLTGNWDPSLAFVMGGAIGVGVVVFMLARNRSRSLLGAPMQLPTSTELSKRLIFGSLAFGVGWGLAGFCPGPAIVSAAAGYGRAWIFLAAMIVGMMLFTLLERFKFSKRSLS